MLRSENAVNQQLEKRGNKIHSRINEKIAEFANIYNNNNSDHNNILVRHSSAPTTTRETLNSLQKNLNINLNMRVLTPDENELGVIHDDNIENLKQLFFNSKYTERELLETCQTILRVMKSQNDEIFNSSEYDNTLEEEIIKFVKQHKSIKSGLMQGDVEFAKEWLKLYEHREDEEKREELIQQFIYKHEKLKKDASTAIQQLDLNKYQLIHTSQILAYSAFVLGIAIVPHKPVLGLFMLACSNSKHNIVNKNLQLTNFEITTTPRSQSLFEIFSAILRYEISKIKLNIHDKVGEIINNLLSIEPITGARDMLLYSSKIIMYCVKPYLSMLQSKLNNSSSKNRTRKNGHVNRVWKSYKNRKNHLHHLHHLQFSPQGSSNNWARNLSRKKKKKNKIKYYDGDGTGGDGTGGDGTGAITKTQY